MENEQENVKAVHEKLKQSNHDNEGMKRTERTQENVPGFRATNGTKSRRDEEGAIIHKSNPKSIGVEPS